MQASNQWDCGRAIAKDPKHGSNTQEIKKSAKTQASLVSCNTEKVILPCVEGIGRPEQQNNYFLYDLWFINAAPEKSNDFRRTLYFSAFVSNIKQNPASS